MGDAGVQMHRATLYYDSAVVLLRASRSGAAIHAKDAAALGYLERLRLGFGSPFRLAELALVDPRLGDDSTRHRVAWAILARLRRGDAYVIDPAVAEGLGPEAAGREVRGEDHVALIERTIASGGDPRVGELTVRLAYALAVGEQTIAERGDLIATQIAALLRDRAQAQHDLRDLVATAEEDRSDLLQELVRRRRDRELSVEQPPAAPLDPALQSQAMRGVPKLLEAIRRLGSEAAPVSRHRRPMATASLLGPAVAQRLVALGSSLPPEPAVAITVRSHRSLLLTPELSEPVREARERLAAGAVNSETLAGEYGRLIASGDTARHPSATTVLATATALRALAQETPWFPGSGAPTLTDLRTEFGIAGVTFDRSVDPAWQPYYLRMVATSIRDVQRVLGGLSVAGLRIAVGASGLPDTVLALHDPKTRTIKLSVLSSAGTLAHELAHDLDWQAARVLYAGYGYSTDRAVREQRGPLASSMRDLAAARIARRGAPPAEERPAEVFARSVDWLVAMSLAREGRSDGYVSAVQDAALTGYTTVSPMGMIFGAARPLVDAVQEMTYLPESVREGFLEQWGDPREVDPYLLVQHVLSMSPPRRRYFGSSRLFADDPMRFGAPAPAICGADGSMSTPALQDRQMLLGMALDARALGIARLRARYYPISVRPAWVNSILGVAPWAPEEGEAAIRRIRSSLVAQLDADRAAEQLRFGAPAIFRSASLGCSLSED